MSTKRVGEPQVVFKFEDGDMAIPLREYVERVVTQEKKFKEAKSWAALGEATAREELAPLADHGAKFKPNGRGPGPIRTAVRKLLARDQSLKPAALWAAIKAKPPRGWTVHDNRLGKYLEGKTPKDHMTYARFANVCSEERGRLRK